MATPPLSDDSLAILLVCSGLGLPPSPDPARRPYGPKGWAKLAERIEASGGHGPGGFVGSSSADIERLLAIPPDAADRLAYLLDRGGQLAIELERLGNLGLWALTIAHGNYPRRLCDRLADGAPPVLFGSGDVELLDRGGLAVVGSRDADARALQFTAEVSSVAARAGVQVVSGAARGVDAAAMRAAFEAGGTVIGVLADSLERRVREPETRRATAEGQAVLVTPYHPRAGFTAGAAMGRNKLIYTLADAALIVAASEGQGGTWAGATEALDHLWVPVYVRVGESAPDGNRRLLARGALEFPAGVLAGDVVLWSLLAAGGSPSGASVTDGGPGARVVGHDQGEAPVPPIQQTLFSGSEDG